MSRRNDRPFARLEIKLQASGKTVFVEAKLKEKKNMLLISLDRTVAVGHCTRRQSHPR